MLAEEYTELSLVSDQLLEAVEVRPYDASSIHLRHDMCKSVAEAWDNPRKAAVMALHHS